jgi:hypothetical protein
LAGSKGTELLAVIEGILNGEAGVAARGGERASEAEIVREGARDQEDSPPNGEAPARGGL